MASSPYSISGSRRRRRQRGMTLVEVLVALVIFALGMLGAGGLIVSSLRSSQMSGHSSVAIRLARDYGEVMQLIPATAASTATAGTNSFTVDTKVEALASAPTSCLGSAATCGAIAMINFSRHEWAKQVEAALPSGRAVVCKDSAPKESSGLYRWACDNSGTMVVVKFGWAAKTGPTGTGDEILSATESGVVRPKMVITLFGNQTDFVSTP